MYSKNNERNIIDGQQRLFTITLILYSIMKIMLFSPEVKELPNIFKNLFSNEFCFIENCDEIESCANFKKAISKETDVEEKENSIWSKLIEIVRCIIKSKNLNIEEFCKQILNNTIFTLTILSGDDDKPNKIFANLNTIQKTLGSLDLVRNYIYSKVKNEASQNNDWNSKTINYVIDFFNNEIFKKFIKKQNKNNEIDNDLLTMFIDNLIFKLNINDNSEHFNKEVSNANRLNKIISYLEDKSNNEENFKYIIENFTNKRSKNDNEKRWESLLKLKIFRGLFLLYHFLNIFLYIRFLDIRNDLKDKESNKNEIKKLFIFLIC